MAGNTAPIVERMWISNFNGMRNGSPIEVRSAAGGHVSRTIGGYAAVFNVESRNLGGYSEFVTPSFFNKSSAEGWPDVICRYNHNDAYLLGSTRSGTLRVKTDTTGLLYDVDLPETRSDVLELVDRRDIVHSSFAFLTYEDDWKYGAEGGLQRRLVSGKLLDVSPVLQPGYPEATVGLRSLAAATNADLDDVLKLSRDNELRKLFVRTDGGEPEVRHTVTAPEVAPEVAVEPEVAAEVVAPEVAGATGTVVDGTLSGAEVVTEPEAAAELAEPEVEAEAEVAEPEPEVEAEAEAEVEPEAEVEEEPEKPHLFGPLEKMRILAKKPKPIEE